MSIVEKNIVTMKWGCRYPSSFVNKLYNSVSRNLESDFRFICFTENTEGLNSSIETFPLPSIDMPDDKLLTGWRKLSLFRDDLPLNGECLFLDLDIVITGDLSRFFSFQVGKIPIIHNWVHWRKSLFLPLSLCHVTAWMLKIDRRHKWLSQFRHREPWR